MRTCNTLEHMDHRQLIIHVLPIITRFLFVCFFLRFFMLLTCFSLTINFFLIFYFIFIVIIPRFYLFCFRVGFILYIIIFTKIILIHGNHFDTYYNIRVLNLLVMNIYIVPFNCFTNFPIRMTI